MSHCNNLHIMRIFIGYTQDMCINHDLGAVIYLNGSYFLLGEGYNHFTHEALPTCDADTLYRFVMWSYDTLKWIRDNERYILIQLDNEIFRDMYQGFLVSGVTR